MVVELPMAAAVDSVELSILAAVDSTMNCLEVVRQSGGMRR